MNVAVCVATYRRPSLLAGLIEKLAPQLEPCDATLVVVDNDDERSAELVVRAATDRGIAIRYATESRPGTPAARNRALDVAAEFDLIAFIDDDVRPAPRWLEALLDRQRSTGADIVTGPVRFVFHPSEPAWASGAHCFAERTPSAVDPAEWPATTNVLIRTDVLRRTSIAFNEAYGLGGEDTEFFRKLGRAGATVAWEPAATVEELVGEDRSTVSWVLRRSYLVGRTATLIDRGFEEGNAWLRIRAAARWLFWGAKGLAAGVARRDSAGVVRALSSVSRAAGIVAGAFGTRFHHARRD